MKEGCYVISDFTDGELKQRASFFHPALGSQCPFNPPSSLPTSLNLSPLPPPTNYPTLVQNYKYSRRSIHLGSNKPNADGICGDF